MSIVDFVSHECQANNTYVFAHANGSASDIHCFLNPLRTISYQKAILIFFFYFFSLDPK